jgi:pimeloyl-ACP methyl ester carboxylesterase
MEIKSKDGTKINYDVAGNGPLIILLHGFGNDNSMWSNNGWIDLLKVNNTVVSLDLRGCGKSAKLTKITDYTIDNYFDDIEIVSKTFQDGPPVLWGWSLGATISLLYSKYRNVESVIACGTYFGKIFSNEYVSNRISTLTDQDSILRLAAFRDWPIVYPNEIKKPFLIYTGTNDGNVVKRLIKQENDIINANGKLVIFDGLDHNGLINQKEKTKEVIINFLNTKAK